MRWSLLIFLLLISSSSNASTQVKIATDPWCPYVCEGEEARTGVLIEVVQQAFAESGYLVEFVSLNWARAIEEARKGKVQGIIGGFKTDSPDFIFGQEHLLYSQMCFYTQEAGSWQFTGVNSLDNRVTAVVNGYSYGDEMDAYIKNNETIGQQNIARVYGKETITQRLKLLAKHKVDTLVEDKLVMTQVKQNKTPSFKLRQAGCLPPEKIYLGFSPNSNLSPRLSRAFDQGLKQLRKQGKIQQIIAKYGQTN